MIYCNPHASPPPKGATDLFAKSRHAFWGFDYWRGVSRPIGGASLYGI